MKCVFVLVVFLLVSAVTSKHHEGRRNTLSSSQPNSRPSVKILRREDFTRQTKTPVEVPLASISKEEFGHGNQSSRLSNGVNARIEDFPFIASLRSVDTATHICAGTIFTDRHILTIAQCVIYSWLYAVVGAETLNGQGRVYQVAFGVYHAEYDPNRLWKDDIAILLLDTYVEFGPNILYAFLPTRDIHEGEIAHVVGWGSETQDGGLIHNLQVVYNLDLHGPDECHRLTTVDVYPGQICGGVYRYAGTCTGDAGDPLTANRIIYGMASIITPPCGNEVPDFYTNVYYYLDWIDGAIRELDNILSG